MKNIATMDHIPVLLREKLGEDFEPEHVLGYRYAAWLMFQKYNGWDSFSQGCSHWRWTQEEQSSPVSIRVSTCWVYGDNHYHTNRLSMWYEAADSSAISPVVAKELNIICRNTVMMIADKYKD